ncbi:MAG: hypothetical protein IPM38_15445 [Ignavibacteria bacterium]|nr:hypothetical protein [Ignavibacteria bacterium]
MKNLLLFLLLVTFSANAVSQEIPVINNISRLNSSLGSSASVEKNAPKKKDFWFTVNPYLWTIAMGGTVGIPNTPSGYPKTYEFNKSFSDALSNLKMAFMIGGKFKYKRINLFYDIVYANLKNFDATLPNGAGLVSANTTVKELITDLSLGYSFPTSSKSVFLDAYAGVRIWSTDTELTLVPPGGQNFMGASTNSWVDPIIGINASFILSKDWFSYLRSDFGGFGANSEYCFMILGGFGYKFNPNINTSLGIKNLSVDYNKDDKRFNLNQYGLILSLGYSY